MATITPEQIRDISVATVEDFLNQKISLSTGLAKRASDLGLNSEQIQRGIETTNTIAYLKIRSISPDQTVEFPLCKYAEVLGSIVAPSAEDRPEGFAKAASVVEPITVEFVREPKIVTHDMLVKAASITNRELEQAQDRALMLKQDLFKVASIISKQSAWMDKLASVADEKEFKTLAPLVSDEPVEYRDFVGLGLFKEAELKDVQVLTDLYKEAKVILSKIDELTELSEKAAELEKTAFVGVIARGIGSVIGKGIGKTLSAPFKAVGKTIAKPLAPIKADFMKDLSNAATPGQKAKITAAAGGRAIKASGKSLGTAVAGAAGLGMTTASIAGDAALYGPSSSKSGRSRDIWSALQKN